MFEENLDAIECLISLTENFNFHRRQNYFEIFEYDSYFIKTYLVIERINKNEARIKVLFHLNESYIEKIKKFSTMHIDVINKEFMFSIAIGFRNFNYYTVVIKINNLRKSIEKNHFMEVINILLDALKAEKEAV